MAAPSDVAKKEETASAPKAVPPVGAKLVRSTTLRIASVYRDSRALADRLFRAMDIDKSGSISLFEMYSFVEAIMMNRFVDKEAEAFLAQCGIVRGTDFRARLAALFESIDRDHNNVIDKDEFIVGLLLLNHDFEHAAEQRAARSRLTWEIAGAAATAALLTGLGFWFLSRRA